MRRYLQTKTKRLINRFDHIHSTYRLTFVTAFALTFLTVFSITVLVAYVEVSISRAQTAKNELFDRDLRDLGSRLDADERFVLEHNIEKLVTDFRELTPLLLPRQYYAPLPLNINQTLPRQPPRNCFVLLQEESRESPTTQNGSDRLCAYFLENQAVGQYLFLGMDLIDNSIVPLKYGDPKLLGDSIRITLSVSGRRTTWWVTFQHSHTGADRYEITAFRELANGFKERDRRLEGWAYSQKQSDGSQIIRVLARVDFKEFFASNEGVWPPTGWEETKITLERRDYTAGSKLPRVVAYQKSGISNLSIASLASGIFNAHATLSIRVHSDSVPPIDRYWKIENSQLKGQAISDSKISFVNGNFVLHHEPIVRPLAIQDTNLSFQLSQSQIVIEQGVWIVLVLQVLLAVGAIFAVFYFYSNLLKPVFVLTRHARHLSIKGTHRDRLPYAEKRNEIGILSSGFNELIGTIRSHVERELRERTAREEAETIRLQIALRNREENLNIIGHEIRSPLQALLSIHKQGSESRKHLDRILAALPHLQIGLTPEQVATRDLECEPVNMNEFLEEIVKNVRTVGMDRVTLETTQTVTICHIDPDVFSSVLDNILRNADRHRYPDTTIRIALVEVADNAIIKITNDGQLISADIKEKIFQYGVSTATQENGYGQGIGLWLAQKHVNMMKGDISASNLQSEGSVCFEIRLPLSKSEL